MNIGIVTLRNKWVRGSTIFYPLIKWEKNFNKIGINFSYFMSHLNQKIYNVDVLIIDSRYLRQNIIHDKKHVDSSFIVNQLTDFRSKGVKIVFFDNSDAAGARYLNLIEYVDVYAKKQLFKNIDKYTYGSNELNYREFIKDYKLDKSLDDILSSTKGKYPSCSKEDLEKLKLSWNIGMEDYRYFPFRKYYPISTTALLNNLYPLPKFKNHDNKEYITSFRGSFNNTNDVYSYQRNVLISYLKRKNSKSYLHGGKVSKRSYLKELERTKICVSPFGWGEVCFRDFEGIISGCLLVKPDMDHIRTYPNIYVKNETYIPLKWDMSDLENVIEDSLSNFDKSKEIIENAQDLYRNAIQDFNNFKSHFIELLKL